ncbi:hypothetical protein [Nocardioides sp. InS609-2]|nr:hypothetical protein [Nocardioides sp. InS609-2]
MLRIGPGMLPAAGEQATLDAARKIVARQDDEIRKAMRGDSS